MLSAVSNVSSPRVNFRANESNSGVDLARPGAYSSEPAADTVEIQGREEGEKKSSSLGKKLLIAAGTAVGIAAALVGLKHFGITNILEVGKTDAKVMEKVSDKLAKAGEWIEGLFSKGVRLEKDVRLAKQGEAEAKAILDAAEKDGGKTAEELQKLEEAWDAKVSARMTAETKLEEFRNPPKTPRTQNPDDNSGATANNTENGTAEA